MCGNQKLGYCTNFQKFNLAGTNEYSLHIVLQDYPEARIYFFYGAQRVCVMNLTMTLAKISCK